MADGKVIIDTELNTKDAEKQSKSLGNSLSSGISKGCKVARTGLMAVGTVAVATGGALVKMAKSTADTGDHIDKMSQKLGISAEAYQKWDYVAKISGTSIDSLKMGFKTLTNTIDKANKGDKEAATQFNKLGVSMDDLKNKSKEDIFKDTVKGLQNVKNQTERSAMANKLFGRSGMEMGALLNSSNGSIDELMKKAEDYGMVMSDKAVKASAEFKDSLTTMQMTFTGLKNRMMGEFLPSLTQVTDGLALVFKGDTEQGVEKINDGITNFIGKLSEIVPKVLEIGGNIIVSLATAIVQNLPQLLETATNIIVELTQGILNALPSLIDGLVGAIPNILQALVNAIPTLLQGLLGAIQSLVQALVTNLPSILQALLDGLFSYLNTWYSMMPEMIKMGIQLILGLVQGVLQALPQLIEMIPTLIQTLINSMIEALPMIIEGVISLINLLIENIPVILQTIIEALPSIINMLLEAFMTAFPQIIEGIITLINMIVENIPTILNVLIEALPTILTMLINALMTALPVLINGLIKLVIMIVQNIPKIIITLIKSIPRIISLLISALISNLPQIIKGLIKLVVMIVQNLPTIIMALIKAIPTIIIEIVKALIQCIPTLLKGIFTMITSTVTSVVKGLPKLLLKLWDFIKGIPSKIVDFFKDLPKKMLEVGKNLIKGLWNGIKDVGKWLWDKISGFVDDTLGWFKDLFGIGSPSKLMRDQVGKWIAKGIWVGFDENDPMKQINDTVAHGIQQLDTNIKMQSVINYDKMVDAFADSGLVVQFNEREVGRMVREFN